MCSAVFALLPAAVSFLFSSRIACHLGPHVSPCMLLSIACAFCICVSDALFACFSAIPGTDLVDSQQEILETTLLAIERINADGGLLPNMWGGPFNLVPIVYDGEGNATKFEELAHKLYYQDEARFVSGCCVWFCLRC